VISGKDAKSEMLPNDERQFLLLSTPLPQRLHLFQLTFAILDHLLSSIEDFIKFHLPALNLCISPRNIGNYPLLLPPIPVFSQINVQSSFKPALFPQTSFSTLQRQIPDNLLQPPNPLFLLFLHVREHKPLLRGLKDRSEL